MGSRAAHNFKRRQKLIFKHTGKEYEPNRKRRGKSNGNYGNGGNNTMATATHEASEHKGFKRREGKGVGNEEKRRSSVRTWRQTTGRSKLRQSAEEINATRGTAARKLKLSASKRLVANAKNSAGALLKEKKIKKKAKGGEIDEALLARRMTRREHRKAWKLARQSMRHRATVICPGSVTDRYARGGLSHAALFLPLNRYERSFLASGPLSWRWLREEDEYEDLPSLPRPPESDVNGHAAALREHKALRYPGGSRKLEQLDDILGVDGLWPRCEDRVKLAAKLSKNDSLQKRCMRYFKETLMPLVFEPIPVGTTHSAPLLTEARRLLVQCATAWASAGSKTASAAEADTINCDHMTDGVLRQTWLRMLRRCLTTKDPDAADFDQHVHDAPYDINLQWWLRALRSCFVARFCAWPDAAAQVQMFRNAALFAARGVSSTSQRRSSSSVVVLPLGIFTVRQAVLLVAAARWLGEEATVVRRTAAGPAEVLFRSADVTVTSDVTAT